MKDVSFGGEYGRFANGTNTSVSHKQMAVEFVKICERNLPHLGSFNRHKELRLDARSSLERSIQTNNEQAWQLSIRNAANKQRITVEVGKIKTNDKSIK